MIQNLFWKAVWLKQCAHLPSKPIKNKTSIQWTPGSQIYLSIKKIICGQQFFSTKKKQQIMHNLCLIKLATITILIDLLRITLPKLHMKFQPHSLKIFWAKVEKVQKTHKICIIMLINHSQCNFSGKKYFWSLNNYR